MLDQIQHVDLLLVTGRCKGFGILNKGMKLTGRRKEKMKLRKREERRFLFAYLSVDVITRSLFSVLGTILSTVNPAVLLKRFIAMETAIIYFLLTILCT